MPLVNKIPQAITALEIMETIGEIMYVLLKLSWVVPISNGFTPTVGSFISFEFFCFILLHCKNLFFLQVFC